jgi:hypothetical protein
VFGSLVVFSLAPILSQGTFGLVYLAQQASVWLAGLVLLPGLIFVWFTAYTIGLYC